MKDIGIKAIFFDVDGTLVSHTINDIPAGTLQALEQLREKGILIFIATGRHISELEKMPLHHVPFDGYVTQTGQICYDGDFHPIYEEPLSRKDTGILVQTFREKKVPIALIGTTTYYINYLDETVKDVLDSINTPYPDVRDYQGEDLFGASIFPYGKEEESKELFDKLKGCKESSWHDRASDIILKEGGKVRGIEKVMEYFGLDRTEIMAFGDEDNDVEMIGFAGIGVAMGNGTGEAKEAADYVTASVDEDGVRKALQHFGVL